MGWWGRSEGDTYLFRTHLHPAHDHRVHAHLAWHLAHVGSAGAPAAGHGAVHHHATVG